VFVVVACSYESATKEVRIYEAARFDAVAIRLIAAHNRTSKEETELGA
jgi:hypothetical protein